MCVLEYTTINTTNLRVLCKNGSLASYPGLDVDDNCALAIITTSEVVSRRSSIKNADLHLILQEFEHWFGVNLHKPFELFNVFNGTKDLLFKVSVLIISIVVCIIISILIGLYFGPRI